jgi:hypothetical protein
MTEYVAYRLLADLSQTLADLARQRATASEMIRETAPPR